MFFKRQLPALIVFMLGTTLVLQYYIVHPLAQDYLEGAQRWNRIIKNCALLLGVASLLAYHLKKINRKQAGYGYSIIVFIGFIPMVVFGLWRGIDAPRNVSTSITVPQAIALSGGEFRSEIELFPADALTLEGIPSKLQAFIKTPDSDTEPVTIEDNAPVELGEKGNLVLLLPESNNVDTDIILAATIKGSRTVGSWMFDYLKAPMEATMFSLLAFFISSATFRAFRARSFEASIMLGAAMIVIVGRISFGDIISSWISEEWLFFPKATNWLMNVPTVAAKRAILLGIALSVIATSVRVIFGIERSYLGKGE